MAELVLTEKEKEDDSYLDWDDAALGALVKKTALLLKDEYGQDATYLTTACHLLIDSALRMNAEESEFTLKGVTASGENRGDWTIKVTKD